MKDFANLLRNYDLEYFGKGTHKVTFEEMIKAKKENSAFILDVRTEEENKLISFNFATNIAISQIPDRLNEIPKDKTIVVFCSSATRATITSVYLQLNGYNDVKILLDSVGDIASNIKPGFALKNKDLISKLIS
ncbi:MAG: rhodanese-like domain-containing protein [Sphaerochaetaceae bacterium]|nr:rhodanese-like domain-containing protein [Sphaerochaetaceae bacterium]MDC7249213.1 rhodanese-like domain-containing protein [Sphaerochaetaceae bacterium]